MARKIEWQLEPKQQEAFLLLTEDNDIDELLFGGGAGGGKTDFGCSFSIIQAIKYKDFRGLIGREEWENLKTTTLLTFRKVLKRFGLVKGVDYDYNGQDKVFTFYKTGSQIYFKYLKYEASDPEVDRLGSTEYSFVFIDETQEIALKVKNVLKTRIRYNLDANGLKPRMLMTCNPSKGWLKAQFYEPFMEGKLPPNRAFIPSLVGDNSYIDSSYIKNLENSDDIPLKERLLYGNWNYDNDPRTMIEYSNIGEMFRNKINVDPKEDYFIISDVARFGKDTVTISLWQGYKILRAKTFSKQGTDETERIIREWKAEFNVALKNILVDEVGVGGGVVDHLKCVGFIANASTQINEETKKKENYVSLKDQCAYRLAKLVNDRLIDATEITDINIQNIITEELAILKTDNKDDKPLKIISKDKMKEILRRSPDWLDNFIMRCYFKKSTKKRVFAVWL